MSIDQNVYLPPANPISEKYDFSEAELATTGRRFGTFVIDHICYFVFAVLLGVMVSLIWGNAGLAQIERIPDLVLGMMISLPYYLVFETIWGRTPGKFIMGTIVVDDAGGKPSFGQLVKRTFSRFIPFEQFSFFGERGWHDSISDTRVVMHRRPI